ncbi:MAG: ATP-binding protein [Lachnospiraceae bacterium]
MLPITVKAEKTEPKIVRVGWYEDAYHITGENGERSGYGYEYEQAVAAYTGWKYEYVKGEWSELLEMLQTGEIDMMGALSYTDERSKTMLFSELPMGEEKYYLYADLVHTDISAYDLSTLNGKRVGMLEQSVQATQFYEWEEKHNINTQHVYVESFEEGKKMAENQELDCVISIETPQWIEFGMSAIATTGGSDIYYCINQKRTDLKEELDNAMRKMESDKPFYADELYKRYLSSVSSPVLSSEESDWLKQHGDIRIGYLNQDSGISRFDAESSKLVGVINDYIVFAASCMGEHTLEFEVTGFDSLEEQLQALKNDEIDMIFHVTQNPYAAEQNEIVLSNTVLALNMMAVTAKSYFDENTENSVAIEKNNILLKWYIYYNYPTWKIVEYDSCAAAEKAVRNRQTDCFIAEAGQLTRYIEDNKLHSVSLVEPGNMSFAVSQGNTILLSILNKTLKTMSSSMLTGALSMYESNAKKVTVIDFIKDNLLAVAVVLISVFLIVLLIILNFLKKSRIAEAKAKKAANQSFELNQKLQESQQELQKALQKAENANAAKSNFLFNMSHDIRTPMNALLGYNQLMKKELTNPRLLHYQEKIEQSGNLLLSIINNVLDMARIESGKMELDENYTQVEDILKEIEGVFESEARKKGLHFTYELQVEHNHILCDSTKVQQIFVNLVSNAVKYTPSGGTVLIRSQELPCDQEGFVRIKTEVIDNGIGMSKEYLTILFDSFTRERNTTIGKVAGTGLGMPIVKEIVDMMGGTIEVESELGKGSKFTVILQHKIADKKYYDQKLEAASSAVRKEYLQGKHILLAEDNDLNAEIAMTILEDMGLKVDRVEDGIQCVSKIEQMPAGTYNLILMDIQMPNMDGYKATRTIRGLSDKEKANITIVAMTANAFEEDRKKAFANGMNGHIAKPIDVDQVEKILFSLLK